MIQSLGNPPKCECHECTQIRWKMSLQGQAAISGQWQNAIPQPLTTVTTPVPNSIPQVQPKQFIG